MQLERIDETYYLEKTAFSMDICTGCPKKIVLCLCGYYGGDVC